MNTESPLPPRRGRRKTVDFEPYKATITKLWGEKGRKLKDIVKFMASKHKFFATYVHHPMSQLCVANLCHRESMYKRQLSSWGLAHNIKKREMQYMAKVKLRRDAIGKRTKFNLRDCPVEARKIDRWIKKERRSLGERDFINSYVDSESKATSSIRSQVQSFSAHRFLFSRLPSHRHPGNSVRDR